jgi:hypothetical protein
MLIPFPPIRFDDPTRWVVVRWRDTLARNQLESRCHGPQKWIWTPQPFKASAPPTISRISPVIAA